MPLLCKSKSIIALLLAALLGGAFLLFLYPIYSASAIRWPKVQSYETVLKDCDLLLQRYAEESDLPKNAWPQSIVDLEPRYVYVGNGFVKITISSGGIGDSWGLIIAARNQIEAVPSYAIKTENPRVFRYK